MPATSGKNKERRVGLGKENDSMNFHITKQPRADFDRMKEAEDYVDTKDTSIFAKVHKPRNQATLLKPDSPYLAYQVSVLPNLRLKYPKLTLVECCVVAAKDWNALSQDEIDVWTSGYDAKCQHYYEQIAEEVAIRRQRAEAEEEKVKKKGEDGEKTSGAGGKEKGKGKGKGKVKEKETLSKDKAPASSTTASSARAPKASTSTIKASTSSKPSTSKPSAAPKRTPFADKSSKSTQKIKTTSSKSKESLYGEGLEVKSSDDDDEMELDPKPKKSAKEQQLSALEKIKANRAAKAQRGQQ